MVRLLLAAGADRGARDKVGRKAVAAVRRVWAGRATGRREAGSWVSHLWHACLAAAGQGRPIEHPGRCCVLRHAAACDVEHAAVTRYRTRVTT